MPRHILVTLSAEPEGVAAEFEAWSDAHIQHMVEIPIFESAQMFEVHPRHTMIFEETKATRPPYRYLNLYELSEEHIEKFLNPDPDAMEAPTPPGGVGPHRPDGYVFVAKSPKYTGS